MDAFVVRKVPQVVENSTADEALEVCTGLWCVRHG